jgi:UDP-N-acetyl-D-mannosaminuronic acid dehydrogenase
MTNNPFKVAVVGGAGHVGLPLSLMLASHGFPVVIVDRDAAKLERIGRGEMPFVEEGAGELLRRLVGQGLELAVSPEAIRGCGAVILTVGTPVDEHLNPSLTGVYQVIDEVKPYLSPGAVLVLRSTLFPGTSDAILRRLRAEGLDVGVSFCPERIAQGYALKELKQFPQIVSGGDARSLDVARTLFGAIGAKLVELPMIEAELAKLYTNAWRYVQFAVANQFYAIAEEKGLDFYRIRAAMTDDYPRAATFPTAGFAAGPCLFKDTMQLAAFSRPGFSLGHAAMLVNETLPDFLVDQARCTGPLEGRTVGILGMAFKPDNDDRRESLAYKLRKLLVHAGARVKCTDAFIQEPGFEPLETVLREAEVLFIGCPHSAYRSIDFSGREVVDCWGFVRSLAKGRA